MIRAIDTKVLAFYQWLVNVSGKKPMWWGEQCCYLLLVGIGFGFFREDTVIPRWLHLVLLTVMVLIAGALWAVSRSELLWSIEKKLRGEMFWRIAFLILMADDILATMVGFGHPDALAISLAFLSYQYFALCEEPPPPKPRTRTTLAGNH